MPGVRVRLDHVSHTYGASEESAPVQVLRDVSLEIASGDFAVLVGASGSGKSTLLNLIGAVERPTAGKVFLDDVETSALDEAALTNIRRHSIGYVFQLFNLIPTLNVFENVAFPLSLARVPRGEVNERVAKALDSVGLSARSRHFPNELSGGEMQRVAIARAVIHRPSLILADEPTGNLDSGNGETVLQLLRDMHDHVGRALSPPGWAEPGRAEPGRAESPSYVVPTVVMATHSHHAASFGDYVIGVADGRVER